MCPWQPPEGTVLVHSGVSKGSMTVDLIIIEFLKYLRGSEIQRSIDTKTPPVVLQSFSERQN